MTAARFWRVTACAAQAGGDLELSELWLCNDVGGRVDQPASISCTATPIAGLLGSLADNNLASVCRFAAGDVAGAGFAIVWDFGTTPADVAEVRAGAGANVQTCLSQCMLEYSNDGVVWAGANTQGVYKWSGAYAWAIGIMDVDAYFSSTAKAPGIDLDASRLVATGPGGGYTSVLSEVSAATGKWYVEMTGASGYGMPGIASAAHGVNSQYPGANAQSIGLYFNDVYVFNSNNNISPISSDGTVGLLIDLDARTLKYTNGASTSAAIPIPWSGAVYLATGNGSSSYGFKTTLNSGGKPFKYAVPAGFKAGFGAMRAFGQLPIVARASHSITFASAPTVPAAAMRRSQAVTFRDMEFGGNGRIWGTNEIETSPNVRIPTGGRVILQRQRDKLLVRETWANPVTGAWEFSGIDTRPEYLVFAEDLEGNYRPVAANKLQAEVIA